MPRFLASRRSAMLTAFAGAAAIPLAGTLPTTAAPLARYVTPRAQRLLDLATQHWVDVKHEMAIEGEVDEASYEAAVARSEGLQAEIEALAAAIFASPVRSFADVVERAAVGFAQHCRGADGELEFDGMDFPDHANAQLLAAVLTLAGIQPESITQLA